jgi:hypothetical protein
MEIVLVFPEPRKPVIMVIGIGRVEVGISRQD